MGKFAFGLGNFLSYKGAFCFDFVYIRCGFG